MSSIVRRAVPVVVWALVAAGALGLAVACSDDAGDSPSGGDGSSEAGAGRDAGAGDADSYSPDGSVKGGGGADGGADGSSGGADGSTPPVGSGTSCAALPSSCGGSKDCCAATVVPGGSYNRANDPSFPATVSEFKLDVYEVTVGRFRTFVNAGKGTQADPPAAGAGAHPKIVSSGWDASFTANLVASTAALKTALACDPEYPMWTDAPGGNEYKPMTCVSWYEALAFCAWDGGRLPTEAEWNYAASGGGEQRMFPWGATLDTTKASYDCTGDGSGAGQCAFGDMRPVGSFSPQGDGKWGHADLVGNVWEWTLDYYVSPFRLPMCNDCADLQAPSNGWRAFRGGSFRATEYLVKNSDRLANQPTRQFDIGIRCARSAP